MIISTPYSIECLMNNIKQETSPIRPTHTAHHNPRMSLYVSTFPIRLSTVATLLLENSRF